MYKHSRPALMTIEEFRSWSRMGRTKIYALLGSGELTAVKIGRRTLIKTEAAEAWLNAQPGYSSPANENE